jgi:hypothetical protein
MTYPVFPAVFPWDTNYKSALRINSSRIQQGVSERSRQGINPVSKSIDLQIKGDQANAIEAFLLERRGRPFRLRYENQFASVEESGNLYNCTDGTIQRLGDRGFLFQGSIQQVRRWSQLLTSSPEGLIVPQFASVAPNSALTNGTPISYADNAAWPNGSLPIRLNNKQFVEAQLRIGAISNIAAGEISGPIVLWIGSEYYVETLDRLVYTIPAPYNIIHYAWRGRNWASNELMQWDALFFPDGAIEVRFGQVFVSRRGFTAYTGPGLSLILSNFLIANTSFVIPAALPITAAYPGSYQYPAPRTLC